MNVRLSIIATTIFLLGATTQALGAINDWTAIGPSGGTVNKIVFNKATPSTVYAVATGGFYRSQDGGVSWQLIKSDFYNAPQDLAIDPSDAARIYVVTPSYPYLYVSTDGGASLSAVTSLPTGVTTAWQVAVSQNGATLYLAAGGRVFYSADRATTWQERTAVSTYSAALLFKLSIDPTDANTLYASARTSLTDAGIFVTHDGAMSWQLLTSGSQLTSLPTDFAINAANSSQIWSARYDGVWASGDKGVTWANVFATPSSAIAIDPSNPMILYAGTYPGGIFRTADAGMTWTDITGNNTAGQLITIAVNPAQGAHVLAGGLNGVSGTTTSGTQWSVQTAGLNSTFMLGLSADPGADRIYMNVQSGGVYYSAAGAATTVPVNNVGSGGLLQLSGQTTLLVTGMLAQPGRLSASLSNGLARSVDDGATWSLVQVTPLGTSDQVFSFASWPGNPQTILAATATTIYRSADGGDLWAPATSGLPANAVVGKFAAGTSDPTTVYASIYTVSTPGPGPTTGFGVYKSTDAGLSWAPANTGIASSLISALAVDPTNAMIVYTATDSALLRSTDGGMTWKPLTWDPVACGGYPSVVAIDPKHPGILIASSSTSVARSVDGGTSWQYLRAAGALPFWSPYDLMSDPNRPENILVATTTSGVQQFTIAPDLSLTVAAPSGPVAVGAVATSVYTVSNLGPFDATGVRVSLQLPSTAQSISAVASGGTCTVAANVATCVFGIARAGASNAITLDATSPSAGPFPLTASVLGDQPDPKPANNTLTTTESIAYLADLSVTATGNASAQVGGAVSYIVVVKNAGPNTATATQLKYQLAPGLTPGTVTSAGATCTSASGLVTCNVGDLAASNSVTVTINATAAAAGTQTSTAAVTSTAKDLITTNNSATSTTSVTAPPLPPPVAPASKGGGGSFSINHLLMLALLLIMQNRARWVRKPRY
jgi:uncharacterized repeat protein (TIGR01451 family)